TRKSFNYKQRSLNYNTSAQISQCNSGGSLCLGAKTLRPKLAVNQKQLGFYEWECCCSVNSFVYVLSLIYYSKGRMHSIHN
uniref:Uncharacterized protein n=1 Tax=Ciona intestinalis TaxID=7719 RepID=H2Y390_CIOIN